MKTQNTRSKSTSTKKVLPLGFQPIQDQCALYRGQLTLRDHLFNKYKDAVAALRAEHMPFIALRAGCVKGEELKLAGLIDANRSLFESPRTRIFHDIKVGLHKQKGDTVITDEERTIALIEKHFPDRLDDLAPSKRTISKKALANLTGAELKKIGVELEADTDAVLIKPQDSDVEKAVAALLADSVLSPQSSELKRAA